jgi:small-conductance mechanosensitive channel
VTTQAIRDWSSTHGLRILFIVLAVLVARIVLLRIVPPAIRRGLRHDGDGLDRAEFNKRAETVSAVVLRTTAVVTVIVAAFFILAEVGFNIAPVIAGVSISGIALGLGAQTLVKDGINGLFILGENQFAYGDTVTLAGVTGTVEEVNLRRTVLRGEDGTVYTIPNSAITVAGNHTRGYSGVYFTIGLSYSADLERAISEIDRIGAELAADPAIGQRILQPPRAVRVDSLEDSYLNLRVSGRVAPGAQAAVTGELRRRIIEDFDRLAIPYRGSPPKG